MKQRIKIPKNKLLPADFTELFSSGKICGVALEYTEFEFMLIESGIVVYDAYSSSHKFGALDIRCGPVGFPFCLGCMTDDGERVAYCGMRLGEEKPTSWRLCSSEGDKGLLTLARDPDAMSTPVPSGVCILSGISAYKAYAEHVKDEIHPLSGSIILNGQTHAVIELFGNKYAVFSSGWGDGRYRCYEGFSASGHPVALLVDFGMIDYGKGDDELVEIEVDVPDDLFIGDPGKSEPQNNVDRWTRVLETTSDPVRRLQAYSRRGYAYHSMNMIDEALGDYVAAVHMCERVTDRHELLRAWSVFDNAAELYIRHNDYDSAIELMKFALDIGDDFYGGAYVRLIDMYFTTGRSDAALKVAQRMIEKRPDDPVANMKYAEACVSAMDYEGAAAAYETLASVFRLYENLFDEAACYIEIGDYASADAALERYPAPEFSEQYWYYKAYIAFKTKKFTMAFDNAKKSHDLDAEYMPALYLLIDIETVMQEYNAVARFAEEYKKLRPDKEYGYNVCAEAHLILGNFSECSRNYAHLYNHIVKNEKYAALAAITAERVGDKKRKATMLKALRKNRSPYYDSVKCVLHLSKNEQDAYMTRSLDINKIDPDFLLCVSVYLTGTGALLPAAAIIKTLLQTELSVETVAQQLRTVAASGDMNGFVRLFKFYVNNYVGKETDTREKLLIAERLARHGKLDINKLMPVLEAAITINRA